MAQRRMFSMHVIDTDQFLDMPASAQALYFHLGMRADDDGFVSGPRKIMKITNSSDDDYKLLLAKQFVIPFESGVCVIRHWRIHNYIQNDRKHATLYTDELASLSVENGHYEVLDTRCIQNVSRMDTEVRLGKVSIGKSRKTRASARHPRLDIPMNETRYASLVTAYGTERVDDYMQRVKDWASAKGKRIADYASAAANWLKRDNIKTLEEDRERDEWLSGKASF